jgi:PhnB protein
MAIHELFIYLRVRDAAKAIEFYVRAFDATEKFRLVEPSGRIGHCELQVGPATLMLSEEFPEYDLNGPLTVGACPVTIHLHVDDADAQLAKLEALGATIIRPATDAFQGERGGTARDPFGYEWLIGHTIEKLTPAQMQARYTKLFT